MIPGSCLARQTRQQIRLNGGWGLNYLRATSSLWQPGPWLARPRNLATRKAIGARPTEVSVKRKKGKGREGRETLLEETSHQTILVKKLLTLHETHERCWDIMHMHLQNNH